jgi:hypothetical protein
MRKLILISVLALASVTAQAGQNSGLFLASGEAPNERIESVNPQEKANPEERKANVKPEAAKPVKAISTPVKQASAPPTPASKPAMSQAAGPPTQVSKPVRQAYTAANRIHARGYEKEEAEARGIAARYGVSW